MLTVYPRSKATYSASSYAAFRPSYPEKLYKTLVSYHKGPSNLCIDLGCGHGVVSRALAGHFTTVLGTDPSAVMIAQARSSTPSSSYPNVTYVEAAAESLPMVSSGTVDMVVAGQAAHWFNYPRLFPELARVVRSGGTLAFWGYKDHVFVDFPRASKIMDHYAHGKDDRLLGPYWAQPGRSIVENRLRDIKPPRDVWTDIERLEYDPKTNGAASGEGDLLMQRKLTLGMCMDYIRTWSSYHAWQQKFPKESGIRDVVDEMFEKMVEAEPAWKEKGEKWKDLEVTIEWGSGILLARKM
ncbi:MAG: hypothetical protein M4579_004093 [Chaenotheca gracillima]|nr:MAG: hypothetical protein M4579_004093 [Chaenotheca gracillima]